MTSKNRNHLVRIAALTLLLLTGACGKDSPEEMLASAKAYLEKNDAAAATIQLKNALTKAPDSAEVRFLLGRALLDSGDAAAAELELRKAYDLKHPADQVSPVLARALLAQGQAKKVVDEFAKVSLTEPEARANLKTTLGQAYAVQGNADAAKAAFDEAVASKGDYAPALLSQARLKASTQDLPGAKAIIDGIIAKSPQNAEAWSFRADLLRAEGKKDEAIAAYQKAIEIRPQLSGAHASVIMMHLGANKVDLAAKQLEAMQKVAPKSAMTLYMQAMTNYTQKKLPEARTAIDTLLKTQPNNVQALQLAGLIAYETRSDLQAQEYLGKVVQRAPDLELGRRTLVLSYLRTRQPTKALAVLQPILQGKDTPAAWLALAGETYMQTGDAATATEYFTKAAKSDPKNPRTQTALALARMRIGQSEQAVADLEQIAAGDSDTTADMALIATSIQQNQFDKALKAIANLEKKQPDSPVVHNLRGNALLGKRDGEAARKSFERALALDPAFLPAATALSRLDYAAKKPDDARKRFEGVLAKDPKNIQAMLAIAELRALGGGSVDEVAGLIGKAVTAAPQESAPRLALAGHYLRNKENAKALTTMQEAMSALPNKPEVLDLAGRVLQINGDTNQALALYGKLAAMLPTAAQPYLRMAEIQVANKNLDGARGSLAKGLALQPDSLPIQRALIGLDVEARRFSDAANRAKEIQKAHPKDSVGFILEGDVNAAQKSWGPAAAAYRAGLKVTGSTELAGRLHATLIADGKRRDADQFAEGWIKSHPKDNGFRLMVADAANRTGNYAVAATHYRAALALQPDNALLLNNLAWSLGRMGDPKAIEIAEKADKLAPNQAPILDTLGTLLIEQGKVERGLPLLEQALKLAPQTAEIRLNLAKGLIKAGKKPDAKKELETLAKLGDRFPGQAEVATLMKGL